MTEDAKLEVGDFAQTAFDMGDDLLVNVPAEEGAFGGEVVLGEAGFLAQGPDALADRV